MTFKNENKTNDFIWVLAGLILAPIVLGIAIANYLGGAEPDTLQQLKNVSLGVEIGSNIIGGMLLLLGGALYASGFSNSQNDLYKKKNFSFLAMVLGAFLICYSPLFISLEYISAAHQISAFVVLVLVSIFQVTKQHTLKI
tara:strand:- start:15538 stop:15960 length:423 start_codon:yes stop_codon:yes gene_type:complete